MAYEINMLILRNRGLFQQNDMYFQLSWFTYLEKKIFKPLLLTGEYQILDILCSSMPFNEKMLGIYFNMQSSDQEEITRQALSNSVDIITFFQQFRNKYGDRYNLFEEQSKFIGECLGIFAGKKLDDLYKLFGLVTGKGKPIDRTPDKEINDFLLDVIHVKNGAVSHNNFRYNPLENPKTVIIWDINKKGRETFRKEYTKLDLHNFLQILIVFSINMQRVALLYSFILRIYEKEHPKED